MNRFCRADVLRILHITARQLAGWQRAGLGSRFARLSPSYDLLQAQESPRPARQTRASCGHSRIPPGHAEAGRRHGKSAAGGQRLQRGIARGVPPQGHSRGAHRRPVRDGFCARRARVVSTSARSSPLRDSIPCHELFTRGVALEEHPSTHDEAIRDLLAGAGTRT